MASHTDNAVPKEPSQLYAWFSEAALKYKKAEENGCKTDRELVLPISSKHTTETTFEQEWTYLQSQELARAETLSRIERAREEQERKDKQEREEQERKDEQEREGWKKQTVKEAKKLGYKEVLFDVGLTAVLEEMINRGEVPKRAGRVVIELDGSRDTEFVCFQVIGKNQALFHSELTRTIVLLRKYKGTLLEGASLTSISSSYVVIRGTTTYKTAAGSRQAIIIEVAL